MTAPHGNSRNSDSTPSALAEGFVLVAMALVAAAITVGLHLQMGLPILIAVMVGAALFAALAGFHAYGRRGGTEQVLDSQVERLQAEIDRLQTPARAPAAPAATKPAAPAKAAASNPAPVALSTLPRAEPPSLPAVPIAVDDLLLGIPGRTAGADAPVPPRPSATTLNRDLGMFRPAEPVLASPAAPTAPLTAQELPQSSPREDDVEMIQNLIKKMAAQVNAAELAREAIRAESPAAMPAGTEPRPIAAAGLEASLAALRTTSSVMRAASAPLPPSHSAEQPPFTAAPSAPPPVPPMHSPDVANLARAIDAGHVDVLLEPILGLADKAARHYEVSIRVRSETGNDLGNGENSFELRARGLLPLFDRARVARSSIIAERMADRGKTGSVFSRASGESLTDPNFAKAMQSGFIDRPALARYMVLSFTQADVRSFTAADQQAVGTLSQLGFRFAITSITDLDMNFEAMASAGFGFVKLDATVFLKGLPIPGGHVPAADVCRYLANCGFATIIQQIADESTLSEIASHGATLGQGTVFGGPRAVKADIVSKPGQAAA